MIKIDVAQNTLAWLQIRAGTPTSSCFDKILSPVQLKPSASAEPYLYQLLTECILGGPLEEQTSDWMERGHELEEQAVEFFEILTDLKTEPGGFCLTDDRRIGCSPDRLIGSDSGLELKCPAAKTHVMYLDKNVVPTKYRLQIQGSMFVTGRSEWHFLSYNPILPPLHILVKRDEEIIAKIDSALKQFLERFDESKKRIEAITGLSLDMKQAA